MDENAFRGLALAGTACVGGAGGRRASASAVTRSARSRRRCFEREMTGLCRAYERRHGSTSWPTTDEELAARCAGEPTFAALVEKIEDLRRMWID